MRSLKIYLNLSELMKTSKSLNFKITCWLGQSVTALSFPWQIKHLNSIPKSETYRLNIRLVSPVSRSSIRRWLPFTKTASCQQSVISFTSDLSLGLLRILIKTVPPSCSIACVILSLKSPTNYPLVTKAYACSLFIYMI